MEFNNKSGLIFKDISHQLWREYEFEDEQTVRIWKPLWLHVSESGGHRLFDEDGLSHYISPGWMRITWEAKPGKPNYVF